MGEPAEKPDVLHLAEFAGLIDGFHPTHAAAAKQRIDYEFCVSNFNSWTEFREYKVRNGTPLERAVIENWVPSELSDLQFYERLRINMARRSVQVIMQLERIALDPEVSPAQQISAAEKFLKIALKPSYDPPGDHLPLTPIPALADEASSQAENEVQELTNLMLAMSKRGMSCDQILGSLRRGPATEDPETAGESPESGLQGAGGE